MALLGSGSPAGSVGGIDAILWRAHVPRALAVYEASVELSERTSHVTPALHSSHCVPVTSHAMSFTKPWMPIG